MEQRIQKQTHRNMADEFSANVERQSNGERTVFAEYGAGKIGHVYIKNKLQLLLCTIYKLTQT